MKRTTNNLMICAMLLGSMMASPAMTAQGRISAGGNGPQNVIGHRGSSQATAPRQAVNASPSATQFDNSRRASASTSSSSSVGRFTSSSSANERRNTVSVNNNGRMPASATTTNRNADNIGSQSTTTDRRSTQPTINYWPGANSATTNANNSVNHRSATVRNEVSNSNSGNNGRRPGNNGYTGFKPNTGNNGNTGNNNNYNYGNNNSNRPGNSYNYSDGRRPGNNYGYTGNYRPNNNRPNNYSYNNGSNKYDRYRYDGNMRPRSNNDRFFWNYRNNDWRRPVMPPARAYRPERIWYYRPTVPASYRPYYGAPSIVSILGVDFGTLASSALNFLYYKGYDIDGYYDNVVYLRNVPLLSFTWPDVMMSYDPYSGFNYAQFVYSTPYYDRSRYNRIYRDLCATYGQPIGYNGGSSMCISWYGGDGRGYVTLNLSSEGGRYYTSLSVGL